MPFAELDRNQLDEEQCSAAACRALWCAVLDEQYRLAVEPLAADTRLEIDRARDWFGGRDFHTVCSLIGLDGVWVYARVRPKIEKAIAFEGAGGDMRDLRLRSRRAAV